MGDSEFGASMMELKEREMTEEILDKLRVEDIMFVHYAPFGAMGSFGIAFYVIMDDTYYRYEASFNAGIFDKAADLYERNRSCRQGDKGIFLLCGGSMGNLFFRNKNCSLKTADGYFIYTKNGKEYHIDAPMFKFIVRHIRKTEEERR